jgi:hypothetical protein
MKTCLICRFANPPSAETCVQCRRFKFPSDVPTAATAKGGSTVVTPHTATEAPPSDPHSGSAIHDETVRGAQSGGSSHHEATAAMQVGPHFEVVRGAKPGEAFALSPGRNVIGRKPATGITIDLTEQEFPEQTWVSREHACVHLDANGVVVEDLKSQNGTFVSRHKLPPGGKRSLAPGEVIQIGTVQLKLIVPNWADEP